MVIVEFKPTPFSLTHKPPDRMIRQFGFICELTYPSTVSPTLSRWPIWVLQKYCWSFTPRSLILATHISANTCWKKHNTLYSHMVPLSTLLRVKVKDLYQFLGLYSHMVPLSTLLRVKVKDLYQFLGLYSHMVPLSTLLRVKVKDLYQFLGLISVRDSLVRRYVHLTCNLWMPVGRALEWNPSSCCFHEQESLPSLLRTGQN